MAEKSRGKINALSKEKLSEQEKIHRIVTGEYSNEEQSDNDFDTLSDVIVLAINGSETSDNE